MQLRRLPTKLPDLVLIEPERVRDGRGYLVETFRAEQALDMGIDAEFVQENHSRSTQGVLRGIHLQTGQAKLIRCARGRIWDVAVDLRPESPTYLSWEGHELDDERHLQLFLPAGFGHGFCVLSAEADVVYKLSTYYDPALETSVAWNDPALGVTWPLSDPVLSARDQEAPPLSR
jgi:dTDP-4-dehydrorhamnose 3,5-epimerase